MSFMITFRPKDLSEADVKSFTEVCSKFSKYYIAVESAGRTAVNHIHAVVQTTYSRSDKLRNCLIKVLPEVNPISLVIKTIYDWQGAVAYCMKEKHQKFSNIPDDELHSIEKAQAINLKKIRNARYSNFQKIVDGYVDYLISESSKHCRQRFFFYCKTLRERGLLNFQDWTKISIDKVDSYCEMIFTESISEDNENIEKIVSLC